jgi:ribonuclease BN (tRNA processing enzyme)
MNNSLIMQRRRISVFAALLVINTFIPIRAASAQIKNSSHPLSWTTLGTQGGPILSGERSQPANVLIADGKPWLVDCGDSALERLSSAGFDPSQVDTAFIKPLAFGLYRGPARPDRTPVVWTNKDSLLTIYGPPGTDVVVAGIMQSLKPSVEIGMGVAMTTPTPEALTKVVIIKDGSDLSVRGVRIRAIRNSHFDNPPGHHADDRSQTLSYRFDYKDYGIGYTGDTSPSDAVARLEKGVNLLVSEVIDLQAAIAMTRESKMSPNAKQGHDRGFQYAAHYSTRGR